MADSAGINSNCLRVQKAIIMAGEVVLSLIVFICYILGYYVDYAVLISTVLAFIFFWSFMMKLDKRLQCWLWTDFIRTAVAATGFIAMSVINLIGYTEHRDLIGYMGDKAWITGGVIGLIAGLLFASDTVIVGLRIRSSLKTTEPPQP